MQPYFARLRLRQIRSLSHLLALTDRTRFGSAIVRLATRWNPSRSALDYLFGYRRVFDTLAEAKQTAAGFLSSSHEHSDNAVQHLRLAEHARPSDYPVLFHLERILPSLPVVFDLGGNVGNLFYCYSKYLRIPCHLEWIVQDIPELITAGREIAREKDETRLHFTASTASLVRADVLLASGSLHYFDSSIGEMLARFPRRPKHLILNRTPLTNGRPVVTVQDAGSYLAACKLFNKQAVLGELQAIGYELIDSWDVPELSVRIPCYPELSVPVYFGCYLKLH